MPSVRLRRHRRSIRSRSLLPAGPETTKRNQSKTRLTALPVLRHPLVWLFLSSATKLGRDLAHRVVLAPLVGLPDYRIHVPNLVQWTTSCLRPRGELPRLEDAGVETVVNSASQKVRASHASSMTPALPHRKGLEAMHAYAEHH